MALLIRWLILTAAIIIVSYLLPGVDIHSSWSAFLAAIAISIINTFIRPIALLLTLPLNIITLGLFTLVINGAMLLLASSMISGFYIAGFGTAILASIILSVIIVLLYKLQHK